MTVYIYVSVPSSRSSKNYYYLQIKSNLAQHYSDVTFPMDQDWIMSSDDFL